MKREKVTLSLLGAALLLSVVAALPFSAGAQEATPAPLADPLASRIHDTAAEPVEDMSDDGADTPAGLDAWATLMDVDGNAIGEVSVTALDEALVFVQVSAEGLPPGFHGFHVHTTGVCDPSSDPPFSSAGGHLNPAETSHAEHAGDLPVLYVAASGSADMALVTDRFTVDQLLDEDGGAIVVHANANNYANIPERYGGPDEETLNAGDSGPRIACGVFSGDGLVMPAPDAMATVEAGANPEATIEAAG